MNTLIAKYELMLAELLSPICGPWNFWCVASLEFLAVLLFSMVIFLLLIVVSSER